MNKAPQNSADCFDPKSGLVPIRDAERVVLENVAVFEHTEVVALPNALGQVLASPVLCATDVPPHSNAAMDGFAINSESLTSSGSGRFKVAGTAYAGKPWGAPCAESETIRVMTGAVMPEGTDTVVMQEEVAVSDGVAEILSGQKPLQNVREAGEDMRKGSVAIRSGKKLSPADLGVIASTGCDRIEVYRQPTAAVFSTGDELKIAGEPLGDGQIYDSNRFLLLAMLQRSGLRTIDLGIISDSREQTLASLKSASESANIIITSGGVSTGSADYIVDAVRELGQLNLWRIAVRPGRPFAFGRIGDSVVFGLPGNPVAVMATYHLLVQPALRKMQGESMSDPLPVVHARATTRFRKKPNRTELYRAVVSRDEEGNPIVSSTGYQGSGLLSSMSKANCFVILEDDEETAMPGDLVKVQLFDGIF